ncbi:MAG: hypothetical protein U0Q15_05770 [Kineosporiaceae bacterium]
MSAVTGEAGRAGLEHLERLERRYRRALLAYPRRYRRERGEEIVSTLMDAAEHAGGVGAGDGAAPTSTARTDVRELAALVAAGLRRRARHENRWWDAVRWASVIMIGFIVLRSATVLQMQLIGRQAGGWLLPRALDDLGWWLNGPTATVLFGALALLALTRGLPVLAWGACALLAGARIASFTSTGRASPALVAVLALAWLAGPLALAVRGGRASRYGWGPVAAVVLLPLAAPAIPVNLASPYLVVFATVVLGAVLSSGFARGLALAATILLLRSMAASWPGGVQTDAVLLAVVALAWAELLDRVINPRLERHGQGPDTPGAVAA